ncbi:MAG: HemK/PrmC family methyltransferase [Actinomycetaceae bacterium]|nr:HemK/PrmC family methyltransferase [Actinomycetaceae bacterium]
MTSNAAKATGHVAVAHAIREASFILREAGIDDAQREAHALALWVLKAENLILASPTMDSRTHQRFMVAVGARARRVPLQHITSRMFFRFLELRSEPGVFVVRPETQMLVQDALDYIEHQRTELEQKNTGKIADEKSFHTSPVQDGAADTHSTEATHRVLESRGFPTLRVLDMCTGSGAIALSLVNEVSDIAVTAIDISDKAIDLAQRNYRQLLEDGQIKRGSTLFFEQADIRRAYDYSFAATHYDVVISNPPYVPSGQVHQMEARQDPYEALYGGGVNGMAIPCLVADIAWQVLHPGGAFFMEHDPSQADDLCCYCSELGFEEVSSRKDLSQRQRWVRAKKPM